MTGVSSAIAVSVVTCVVFVLLGISFLWLYADDGEDEEYENLKKTVEELKKEVGRISDLSDRIWNAEIDLKNHKKDCNMTGIKLEVVELLEDRIARLEGKKNERSNIRP